MYSDGSLMIQVDLFFKYKLNIYNDSKDDLFDPSLVHIRSGTLVFTLPT